MKAEEIKLAFAKNIKLNTESTVSAYIQLPAGVHVIGDKKYTVSNFIQNQGTDNEYETTVIDLIEPATSDNTQTPQVV